MAVNMTELRDRSTSLGQNISEYEEERKNVTDQTVGDISYTAVLVLILITFGILQNLVIIALYLGHSKLVVQHRRWSMVFLAFADMLLAINLMMSVFATVDGIIAINVFCSVITVQIWTLCLLIMDRFLCVVFPFRFPHWLPDKKLFLCCLLLWVVAFLLNMILPLNFQGSQRFILMGVSWIPPSLLNTVTFIWIQRKVIQVKVSEQRGHVSLDQENKNDAITNFKAARKSICLCLLVNAVSFFGPCNYALSGILLEHGYDVPGIIHPISMYMTLVSTVVNPWIHSIKVRVLCCNSCCKGSSGNRISTTRNTEGSAQNSGRNIAQE